ncbi:conserved hypothetical protein [Ricinus communis]|uniref:Uncharacterized protein n=1 Tax=Ricinus communis TaxID=3988 RepID=B9T2P5_RICCO|nr:conserved hypothetical protein [Ricinus communis]
MPYGSGGLTEGLERLREGNNKILHESEPFGTQPFSEKDGSGQRESASGWPRLLITLMNRGTQRKPKGYLLSSTIRITI